MKEYVLERGLQQEIAALAAAYGLRRVILFGSRARRDNRPTSDIDLAVRGGDVCGFQAALDEEVSTLLLFDVVNLDGPVQAALLAAIERDGVTIYEEV